MGRNENLYINELINYYLNIGVDTLFLYEDNIEENERFINVITPNDSIVIEYTKNYSIINQGQSFTHCYSKHKDEYDFLIMIDMDEYLIINNNTLKGYLSDKVFDKCHFIKINWRDANDNDLLYYENKSLFERFKGPFFRSNYIKTILKGGINHLKYWIHSPRFSPEKNISCDNNGKVVNDINNTNAFFQYIRPHNSDKAYFWHFSFKSTEEYIKKVKRGYRNWPHLDPVSYIKMYFKFNKLTIEKVEMFEKAFNLTLNNYRIKLKKKSEK